MQARPIRLLIPILALALVAGCAPIKERYWPAEVTKSAGVAAVTRSGDTITIVTHAEGNDGNPVSPNDWSYNAALLRAARETEAAGYSRFQVFDTDTYVISDIINQIGAPQRVRYTMTIRPANPGDGASSQKYHDTAEVLAGPLGGLL